MLGLFRNYIKKRIGLLKLEATENMVKTMSIAVYIALLLVFSISVFLFFFIAVSLGLGDLLGNYAYGFLIVSVFFLLCLLVIFYQKKNITEYFEGRFIQKFFTKKNKL